MHHDMNFGNLHYKLVVDFRKFEIAKVDKILEQEMDFKNFYQK